MARPSRPLPPRVFPPDLPPDLERGHLTRGGEVQAALVEGLAGDVDAAHARVLESLIDAPDVGALVMDGATLTDVEVRGIRAMTASFRAARWQTVRVQGGRIATLDLSRAELSGVELRGLRIDYLSLAGSTVGDLLVVDCVIGSLDAPQATLARVAFEGSRVEEVDDRGWKAEDVDLRGLEALRFLDVAALRGVTLDERQVTLLAPDLARAVGVDVRG